MACGFQCKWCADNRYEMSSRCRFFSSKKKMKMKKKFINYFVKLVPWLKSLKINIRFLKWKRTEEMIWVAWCVPEWRFVEMFGTQWHRGCHRGYVSWTASEKCQRRIHHIHTLPHELKNELGFVAFLFHTHTHTLNRYIIVLFWDNRRRQRPRQQTEWTEALPVQMDLRSLQTNERVCTEIEFICEFFFIFFQFSIKLRVWSPASFELLW